MHACLLRQARAARRPLLFADNTLENSQLGCSRPQKSSLLQTAFAVGLAVRSLFSGCFSL